MNTAEKAKGWAVEARKLGMENLAQALERFAAREAIPAPSIFPPWYAVGGESRFLIKGKQL